MSSTIYIHFIATQNNRHILQMFFEDWADDICKSNVQYSVVEFDDIGLPSWGEIIKVDFEREEDATLMRLRGIPKDLQKYLTFTAPPIPLTY